MNFALILHLTGAVLVILSLFMAPAVLVSILYGSEDLAAIVLSVGTTLAVGSTLHLLTRQSARQMFRNREVFVVVTLAWLSVSFFGALPYLYSGSLASLTDACFESMAGFTTTGATVLTDIEAVSRGVLFWRHLTQWVGGMGIILFALAVMPVLGAGGVQLFKAEVPEITVDRLRPRIVDTAKALWYIYASLTAAAIVLYSVGGMDPYDAFCHAFTTLATGGFSTRNASVAYFDSAFIDSVCTLFMFLAGVNYTLYFFAFRGHLGRFWQSSEFRFYVLVTGLAIVAVTLDNYGTSYDSLVDSSRYASFQVVSLMTTTGYATADYELWAPFSQMLLIVLMFFGGMIGSTGGGMKQVRILLMFKQAYRELYQLVHPRAVTSLKLDGRNVTKDVLGSIWGFLFLFLFICMFASLLIAAMGVDIVTASSTVLSAMSNVGPALGQAGPTENYAGLPSAAKWVLFFCMMAGRLEVFTVAVLFIPRFWKK